MSPIVFVPWPTHELVSRSFKPLYLNMWPSPLKMPLPPFSLSFFPVAGVGAGAGTAGAAAAPPGAVPAFRFELLRRGSSVSRGAGCEASLLLIDDLDDLPKTKTKNFFLSSFVFRNLLISFLFNSNVVHFFFLIFLLHMKEIGLLQD